MAEEKLETDIDQIFIEMREGDDVVSDSIYTPTYALDIELGDFVEIAGVEYFVNRKKTWSRTVDFELRLFTTRLDEGRSVLLSFFKYHLVNIRRNQ